MKLFGYQCDVAWVFALMGAGYNIMAFRGFLDKAVHHE
jgi:hypothetical protein